MEQVVTSTAAHALDGAIYASSARSLALALVTLTPSTLALQERAGQLTAEKRKEECPSAPVAAGRSVSQAAPAKQCPPRPGNVAWSGPVHEATADGPATPIPPVI
jgi:hypothetical protein